MDVLDETGNFLSSQPVSRQVLSASECLTTVFGMGTGGTIQASSPDIQFLSADALKTRQKKLQCICYELFQDWLVMLASFL